MDGQESRLGKQADTKLALPGRCSCCYQQGHTPQLGFNPNIPLSLSHSFNRQSLSQELLLIGQSQVTWISPGCQGKKRGTICI